MSTRTNDHRADQGCACHGADLLRCPNYQPQIRQSRRHLPNLAYASGLRITRYVLPAAAVVSCTVRLFNWPEVAR